jgi:hypothetical protein
LRSSFKDFSVLVVRCGATLVAAILTLRADLKRQLQACLGYELPCLGFC